MSSVSAATLNPVNNLSLLQNGGQPRSSSGKPSDGTGNARDNGPTVIVSLSVEAQVAVPVSAAANYYVQFFPTQDGVPASALAAGVANPGSTSSSSGKSFGQVATDARARMDAKYTAMEESGKPFDYNSFEGKDWNTLFGDLDRRSLYAVSSNAGGLFTKIEQDIAQSIMNQQQGLAMGLYSGPASQAGKFIDPYRGDNAGHMKAGIKFLDAVSPEEKGSFAWAEQRAATQFGYEMAMRQDGKEPEKLDSDSPLVKMIKSAMDALRILNDPSKQLKDMPQYKEAEAYYAARGSSGSANFIDVKV